MEIVLALLLFLCLLLLFIVFIFSKQAVTLRKQKTSLTHLVRELEVEKTNIKTQNEILQTKLQVQQDVQERFKIEFKSLSADALKSQAETYLLSANTTFKEREESIEKLFTSMQNKIENLALTDIKNAADFRAQISNMQKESDKLSHETMNLANALKKPHVRGRWGELQLERILEMSGLQENIDYKLQEGVTTENGRTQRLDVVVYLADKREVILDSKVSLTALLESTEADDEQSREEALQRHVKHIRSHVEDLASKEYWQSRKNSLDYVVMVMPEFAFLPAIRIDKSMTEWALNKKIIVATPTVLLALLRAIAMIRKQTKFVETAEKVRELGKELYARLSVFAEHFVSSGDALRSAVDRYNKGVASWNSRVAPSAARFLELHVPAEKKIPSVNLIDKEPKQIEKLLADDEYE